MKPAFNALLTALRHPESMACLHETEWDALLRHSRRAGLLSRLSLDAQSIGIHDALPERVRKHMRAAMFVAERQIRAVRWEVHKVHEALGYLDIPIVLLKGAAYVMADLPPARGRLFGDIDLLVPKERLGDVEMQLRLHGWHGVGHDAYDQRYYREWMHEIPPVTHMSRGSTLDVHHNILPPTARLKPQASDLLAEIIPIPGHPGLYRLGDADLVLHSATHLFHEGEWDHGLRDLVDLYGLIQYFAHAPAFLDRLAMRAEQLDLSGPMRLALFFVNWLLRPSALAATNIPPPHPWHRWLFSRGLASTHPDFFSLDTRLALFSLYIRSHALRMPLHLLLPHLLHKAFISRRKQNEE